MDDLEALQLAREALEYRATEAREDQRPEDGDRWAEAARIVAIILEDWVS